MQQTTRFDTILIANRGEIACRVIRSAREMGLRTVAVYSDADRRAPHVALADDARRIGPGPVGESYLSAEAILAAAQASGAGAIHPGYGFLSENADFARAVARAGLVFVGPPPEAIEQMGDKAGAKRAMLAAGVPCVPGYEGDDQSDATLTREAARIGYPVMVKASAGGGGRGMRLVDQAGALPGALQRARSEALNAFGSDLLILEKAIRRPRHVEIQIFADAQGNCIHLGERDCSVQRRHQKVVEEAPCPVMTPDLRAAMGAAAIAAAQAVAYRGAGTVEFLLDQDGQFYFLEMNTRLQVEHPVTEMVTGTDLVAMQIAVAQGAPLGLRQEDITLNGHAIEVRLYAEDPTQGFLPATGQIRHWAPATGPGLRVDAGITTGQEIPPFYDPMLAKLIAWGETRDIARQRLIAGLRDTVLLGPANNRGFLADILKQESFARGAATTAFIDDHYPDGIAAEPAGTETLAIAAALILQADHDDARAASTLPDDGLRGLGAPPTPLELCADDQVHRLRGQATPAGWVITGPEGAHKVDIDARQDGIATLRLDGRGQRAGFALDAEGIDLSLGLSHHRMTRHRPWEAEPDGAGSGRITAPMPGLILSLAVAPGDRVDRGQVIAVLEAMKMQHQLTADIAGRVAAIPAQPGQQVNAGALLAEIEEDQGP